MHYTTSPRRFWTLLPAILAAVALAVTLLPRAAYAHSLKELEEQLVTRDKYFQAVDFPAPNFDLIDARGREIGLGDYADRVVILNFIYAGCGDVCPLHSQLFVKLQSMINISPMKGQVAFVSVTTDPSRDHGTALTEYGAAQGLDPVNWTFLTSRGDQPEGSTRRIAKAYGLEFTEVEGMQMHGVVTHVIDRQGRLRGRFHGLGFEPVSLVTFVNALVNDVHSPGEEEAPDDGWSWLAKLFGGQQ